MGSCSVHDGRMSEIVSRATGASGAFDANVYFTAGIISSQEKLYKFKIIGTKLHLIISEFRFRQDVFFPEAFRIMVFNNSVAPFPPSQTHISESHKRPSGRRAL